MNTIIDIVFSTNSLSNNVPLGTREMTHCLVKGHYIMSHFQPWILYHRLCIVRYQTSIRTDKKHDPHTLFNHIRLQCSIISGLQMKYIARVSYRRKNGTLIHKRQYQIVSSQIYSTVKNRQFHPGSPCPGSPFYSLLLTTAVKISVNPLSFPAPDCECSYLI